VPFSLGHILADSCSCGWLIRRQSKKREPRTLFHKSTTTSPLGSEQHTKTFPCAGLSSGSGEYTTLPEIRPLSQLWQTPLRHAQRTGPSQAQAISKMLPYRDASQCAEMPLRANDTSGPVFPSPLGACGSCDVVPTTPGVMDSPPLKISS